MLPNEPQYLILRYFAKVKKTGVVTLAHLKCMKPIGKDYDALVEIHQRRLSGESVSEVIPFTDAQFDTEKLKELFVSRSMMTAEQFDDALATLKVGGYLTSDEAVLTKAEDEFTVVEAEKVAQFEQEKRALEEERTVKIIQ